MKSIFAIHSAIAENMENMLMKCAPQGLIIGTPISQYALHSAMFCPLHGNISKEQHHPVITENTENTLVKHAPHTSIHESYNASVSVMSNSFHNIVSKA